MSPIDKNKLGKELDLAEKREILVKAGIIRDDPRFVDEKIEQLWKAFSLWKEGFIPTRESCLDNELVERRWRLRETVSQIGPKEAKERSRFRESELDSIED